MSEPFLAEVRMVGFSFPPRGWALCDGQVLPINQNQALFSLIGTTYGGDGRTTFALPDLRGRTPIHTGDEYSPGQKGGEESHVLTTGEMPLHRHAVTASSEDADAPIPQGNNLAAGNNLYHDATTLVRLRSGTLATVGSGKAHENMQPYLALNFCIALQGLFPPRN